jgi:YHS domain-containing protein
MGEASGYIYRAKGQPDRVVFFCCEGCGDDFKANPAKFLAKVDDAAAQAAKSGKKG